MATGTIIQLTRVGRWMSFAEYDGMLASNMVQQSFSGTTHVGRPPDVMAFFRQAKPGSVYIEFDVPSACLKQTGRGWAKIIGPQSIEGRLAARKGWAVPQMPPATNIMFVTIKH